MSNEQVNHPSHYGGENNPYETIKVIDDWGLHRDFYVANAVKYISRAGKKGDIIEDLQKAVWYLKARAKIDYDYSFSYSRIDLVDVLNSWNLDEELEWAIWHIYVGFVQFSSQRRDLSIKFAIERIESEINRLNNERS